LPKSPKLPKLPRLKANTLKHRGTEGAEREKTRSRWWPKLLPAFGEAWGNGSEWIASKQEKMRILLNSNVKSDCSLSDAYTFPNNQAKRVDHFAG
jgi:hypothetical protein